MSKSNKVAAGVAVFLIGLAIIAAGIALGGLIIWFFGNILLEAFDQEKISYWVAFAASALLWFVGGLFKSNKS